MCAILFNDSESMIPDDSALAATNISPGGTAVPSLAALVEEALAILSPKLFGLPREYDEMASKLGNVSNTSDALGSLRG